MEGTSSSLELPSYLKDKSQRLAEATDVVLVVGGKEFPVHSTGLSISSKFFHDLFNDLPGGGGEQAGAGGGAHGPGRRRARACSSSHLTA